MPHSRTSTSAPPRPQPLGSPRSARHPPPPPHHSRTRRRAAVRTMAPLPGRPGPPTHLFSGPGWHALVVEETSRSGRLWYAPYGPVLTHPSGAHAVIELLHHTAGRRGFTAHGSDSLRTAARVLGETGSCTAFTSSVGGTVVSALLPYDSPTTWVFAPLRDGLRAAQAAPQPAADRPGAARRRSTGSARGRPLRGGLRERPRPPLDGIQCVQAMFRRGGRNRLRGSDRPCPQRTRSCGFHARV